MHNLLYDFGENTHTILACIFSPKSRLFIGGGRLKGFFYGGTFFVFYIMSTYYDNANEFKGVEPIDYVMPYDVKRLIKHNRHTFMKRFYFYSPSERKFYRYFEDEQRAVVMNGKIRNEKTQSIRYSFVPDISYSVGDKIRDDILLSRFFMKRIEGMKVIDL